MDIGSEKLVRNAELALDARARRAAKRCGLFAVKSKKALWPLQNHGGFRLVDARYNCAVSGLYFDLTAEDVLDYCAESV